MSKKKDDDVSAIRRDDRNLSVAGKRWEEDIEDPAIEILREIREDVENDE